MLVYLTPPVCADGPRFKAVMSEQTRGQWIDTRSQ
jgi:hypothetical protein